MTEEGSAHRRRPRYKGTHPRQFEEKYKELQPSRYREEVVKVVARGQTPAGMHRSIMVGEILEVLRPQPGARFLDATLGYGGHAQAMLERLRPGGHLWGLDVDPLELPRTEARLREAGFGTDLLTVRRMNFAGLPGLLAEVGPFDGILADLGLSSMQIDNPARGFTFKAEGPLDLRLNPHRGKPASRLLVERSEADLIQLLQVNADEPQAVLIAAALQACDPKPETTHGLAQVIRQALRQEGIAEPDVRKSLQRTFQALRIEVNDEFGVLDQFLAHLPRALAPGGRVAILSFHSGEDRRVKQAFLEGFRRGDYAEIVESPQRPGAQERRDNPRSAPAKLRWAIKA